MYRARIFSIIEDSFESRASQMEVVGARESSAGK
jgi:hypothetical protein